MGNPFQDYSLKLKQRCTYYVKTFICRLLEAYLELFFTQIVEEKFLARFFLCFRVAPVKVSSKPFVGRFPFSLLKIKQRNAQRFPKFFFL